MSKFDELRSATEQHAVRVEDRDAQLATLARRIAHGLAEYLGCPEDNLAYWGPEQGNGHRVPISGPAASPTIMDAGGVPAFILGITLSPEQTVDLIFLMWPGRDHYALSFNAKNQQQTDRTWYDLDADNPEDFRTLYEAVFKYITWLFR